MVIAVLALGPVTLTLAQPPSQPAPDLVDGIEICHVEDVGIFWLRCYFLQLLLQCLPDAHSKHPDASFGSCLRGLQNIILASPVCEEDSHFLDASSCRPRSVALREDVGGGVTDSIPGHCIPPQVADVTGSSLYILQGPVASQVELNGGSVTEAYHSYSGFIRCHVEGVHKVGHPLSDFLKVLFSNTGRGVKNKRQVVVDIFTTCGLTDTHNGSTTCRSRVTQFSSVVALTCSLCSHSLSSKS